MDGCSDGFEYVGKDYYKIRDISDSYREIEQVGAGAFG